MITQMILAVLLILVAFNVAAYTVITVLEYRAYRRHLVERQAAWRAIYRPGNWYRDPWFVGGERFWSYDTPSAG